MIQRRIDFVLFMILPSFHNFHLLLTYRMSILYTIRFHMSTVTMFVLFFLKLRHFSRSKYRRRFLINGYDFIRLATQCQSHPVKF